MGKPSEYEDEPVAPVPVVTPVAPESPVQTETPIQPAVSTVN